jgi:hypothetical protein
MGIDNWFEFGGDGGAAMWMEGLDRNTPNISCHSGNRCVGMELTDIAKSRRSMFNIYLQNLIQGDELFVSVWLYLPPDWQLHLPSGYTYRNWYEIADPYFTGPPAYQPYSAITIYQKDSAVQVFDLAFELRDASGAFHTLKQIPDYPVPRGRWFNLQYYVYRHETNGIVRAWIDGALLFDGRNIPTKNASILEWKTIPAKIYYDTNDRFSPYRIWVDDLEIYEG